jgi:hypothetical protein
MPRSGNSNQPPDNSVLPGYARVSRQVPVVLPAATRVNNTVVPSQAGIAQAGNRFYVLSCSAPVSIQAIRAGSVGAANSFGIGQGQPVSAGFETLSVSNYSLNPVVALIWVGFDDFVNDQLILATNSFAYVVFPTYKTASSATNVNINDLSGTSFTDINGKLWGAIARVAILVFNTDPGATLLLQKAGTVIGTGVAVGVIYPNTPIRFDFSGNYALNLGGAPVPAIVSEIYQAIPL